MQSVLAPPAVSPPSGTPAKPPLPRIFEDALGDFKKSLSQKELAQFQCVDFKVVEDTIKSIECDQKGKKKMLNLARIKSFLDAMNQYGKIIEVFIIAYIWVSSWTLYLLRCVCY